MALLLFLLIDFFMCIVIKYCIIFERFLFIILLKGGIIIKGPSQDLTKFILVLTSVFLLGVTIIFNLSESDATIFFEAMKFLFSIIAAYVGIRAVVNSSKSAALSAESVRIASESMRVTKEKELREQSSHLVPVSPTGKFTLSIPNTKEELIKSNFYDPSLGRHDVSSHSLLQVKNRYKSHDLSKVIINTLNVGKGTCINLEYTFRIKNIKEYSGYYYSNQIFKSVVSHFDQYNLSIEYQESELIEKSGIVLRFKDVGMATAMERVNIPQFEIENASNSVVVIEKESYVKYMGFVKPQSEIELPIPNEFMILCKQYLIAKNNFILEDLRNDQNQIKSNSRPIRPIGEVVLKYHDESLIRSGELSPDKKSVLEYTIVLKDIESNSLSEMPFYLEINLSKPEA